MGELIQIRNDIALLSEETALKLHDCELAIKKLTAMRDELKTAILCEMEAKEIKTADNDIARVTKIDARDQEEFDKKAFRAKYPLIYDEFVSFEKRAPYIKVTWK